MILEKNARGTYVARIKTEHGHRTVSTDCTNLEDAKEVVKRSKINELELASKATRMTSEVVSQIVHGRTIEAGDAIKDWFAWAVLTLTERTAINHRLNITAFLRDEGLLKKSPGAISSALVSRWVNDGGKVGTRRVRLSSLRGFFAFCAAKNWCLEDPTKLVRVHLFGVSHALKEPRAKLIFTEADYQLLLKETEGFWRAAVIIGRNTGLRLGDICQLEWDCFNFVERKMTVWTDKRDRRVVLPLNKEMLAEMTEVSKLGLSSKHCFPEQCACVLSSKRSLLSVQFGRLCAKLKLAGHSFHDLRHTYVTEMDAKGVPLEHISRAVGHSSTKTTEGYLHRASLGTAARDCSELDELVEKLTKRPKP